MKIYRVNILARDKGEPGVILDAHFYNPDGYKMGDANEIIILDNVHPLAPREEFMGVMHAMLERIGCPNPTQAEIRDMRT